MQITDVDHLSTPADMVDVLRRLTKIMRDVEALPDAAQQHFWDDTARRQHDPPGEYRLDDHLGARSTTVLYSILSSMCGPRLAEMVNGSMKEYYETLLSQMKEMTHCAWDTLLDRKFDEARGTDHEGSITASVTLRTAEIGPGTLRRIDDESSFLVLTNARPDGDPDGDRERYFLSKDILLLELPKPSPTER